MADKKVRDDMFHVFIRMQKQMHRISASGTLPPAIFHLLHLIYHNSSTMNIDGKEVMAYEVSDFAKTLKVSKPAISKVLRECEAKGYCKKVTMSDDKRKSVVILQEKGIRLCQNVDAQMRRKMDQVIDQLGEADAREFIRIMTRLQEIIKKIYKKEKKAYDEIEEIS